MCRLLLLPSSSSSCNGLLLLLLTASLTTTSTDAFATNNMQRQLLVQQRAFVPRGLTTAAFSQQVSSSTMSETVTSNEDDETELLAPPIANNGSKEGRITKLESLNDFLNFLAEDDRLCVIKFHADWCKSCQRFGVKYSKLAISRYGADGPVRFASVEYGANLDLCRSLGVKKLPTIHIYKQPMGRVAQFACGPSKFPMLVDKLARYVTLSDDELTFEKNMEEGGQLADSILKELQQEAANGGSSGVVAPTATTTTATTSESVKNGRKINDLWAQLEAKVKRLAES